MDTNLPSVRHLPRDDFGKVTVWSTEKGGWVTIAPIDAREQMALGLATESEPEAAEEPKRRGRAKPAEKLGDPEE